MLNQGDSEEEISNFDLKKDVNHGIDFAGDKCT